MIEFKETNFSDCFQVIPRVFEDERGQFIKSFHQELYSKHGVDFEMAEEFFSTSRKGVFRGFHFQEPPSDCAKLLYVIDGRVQDVLIDLRKDSPTYGQHESFFLDADSFRALYVPKGIAHGFLTLSDRATMVYKMDRVYDPDRDGGVSYQSFPEIEWEGKIEVVSERDKALDLLNDYSNPF